MRTVIDVCALRAGIDVNPRFHDCRAFEFTDEVAIFDLLQVQLLHGWLVDPQVPSAVRASTPVLPAPCQAPVVPWILFLLQAYMPDCELSSAVCLLLGVVSATSPRASQWLLVGAALLLACTGRGGDKSHWRHELQRAAVPPHLNAG